MPWLFPGKVTEAGTISRRKLQEFLCKKQLIAVSGVAHDFQSAVSPNCIRQTRVLLAPPLLIFPERQSLCVVLGASRAPRKKGRAMKERLDGKRVAILA